jgi:hypothetical protein
VGEGEGVGEACGDGLGEGDGVGLGDGEGEGDAFGLGECEGGGGARAIGAAGGVAIEAKTSSTRKPRASPIGTPSSAPPPSDGRAPVFCADILYARRSGVSVIPSADTLAHGALA